MGRQQMRIRHLSQMCSDIIGRMKCFKRLYYWDSWRTLVSCRIIRLVRVSLYWCCMTLNGKSRYSMTPPSGLVISIPSSYSLHRDTSSSTMASQFSTQPSDFIVLQPLDNDEQIAERALEWHRATLQAHYHKATSVKNQLSNATKCVASVIPQWHALQKIHDHNETLVQ